MQSLLALYLYIVWETMYISELYFQKDTLAYTLLLDLLLAVQNFNPELTRNGLVELLYLTRVNAEVQTQWIL